MVILTFHGNGERIVRFDRSGRRRDGQWELSQGGRATGRTGALRERRRVGGRVCGSKDPLPLLATRLSEGADRCPRVGCIDSPVTSESSAEYLKAVGSMCMGGRVVNARIAVRRSTTALRLSRRAASVAADAGVPGISSSIDRSKNQLSEPSAGGRVQTTRVWRFDDVRIQASISADKAILDRLIFGVS
jgi:hypothetical protein